MERGCDLVVSHEPLFYDHQGDIAALNNSFGFGGANVAVAFGSAT